MDLKNSGLKLTNCRDESVSEPNQLLEIKNELLNIIHDLKNPSSIISGYLELIQDGSLGELSPEIRDIIGRLIYNTKRINKLINDLGDLTDS